MARGIGNRLLAAGRASRSVLDDERGLAAVEMALIMPVALLLMSLIVYGGQIFGVQRRVTLGATTVANIFAQANNNGSATLTTAEKDQILSYPNLILFPYDGSAVKVEVSQLQLSTANGKTTGTVVGSWANANGTARPMGQQMSVNSSIAAAFTGAAKSYVILGEVQYPFQPTGIYYSIGATTLQDSVMMIPRTAAQITVK